MSGGRLEFGLGAGWFEKEHLAYGIPFPASAGERLARLAEQLELITGLWRTPVGETYAFDGTYYQLGEGPALPSPSNGHRRRSSWEAVARKRPRPSLRDSQRNGISLFKASKQLGIFFRRSNPRVLSRVVTPRRFARRSP